MGNKKMYIPTRQEIREAIERIQLGWSPAERAKRAAVKPKQWQLPEPEWPHELERPKNNNAEL